MEEDDDFLTFDPRLRWAEENNEDLGLLLLERAKFEKSLEVLRLLEEGPKNSTELMQLMNWDTFRPVRASIQLLKRYQVKIKASYEGHTGLLRYSFVSKPYKIKFCPPVYSNL